jgi:hypothetical protein
VTRTQADLELLWRTLMEPLGFTRSSVWLLLVGPDGVPVRQLVEIDDAHDPPDADARRQLAALLRDLVPPDGHRVAFLRTRPGRGGLTRKDRRWAQALYAAARAAAVPCEVVHAANDARLVPVPLDELALRRTA